MFVPFTTYIVGALEQHFKGLFSLIKIIYSNFLNLRKKNDFKKEKGRTSNWYNPETEACKM